MKWIRDRLAWLPYTVFKPRDLLIFILIGVGIGVPLGFLLGLWSALNG